MQAGTDDPDRTNLHRPVLGAMAGAKVVALDSREIGDLAAVNPMVAAANPLLMTAASLRSGGSPASVDVLRSSLIEMINDFNAKCTRAGIAEEHQHLARYALCAFVDETIQRTAWSHTANWAQRSLSIHFFKDNKGGENFFALLDKLVQSPSKYTGLIQLYYVCLSLGFMGRYLMRDALGRQEVTEIRERLFQQIVRPTLPDSDRRLSVHWEGLRIEARQFKGYPLVWVLSGLTALVCLAIYTAFVFKLSAVRDDVGLAGLAIQPRQAVTAPPPAPPPAPRLPQLLVREIASGQVTVRETAAESVVTLASGFAFDSGSATPKEDAVPVIARVSEALARLPGKVVVTGHTDNVPSRTLRFPSNYELSKARALAVADLLRANSGLASRVVDEGRADSEPVQSNQSPEGRAANRRVEITLRVSAAAR